MERETYYITIEVRDANHKLIADKNGNKLTGIKSELSFDTKANYLEGIKGALKSQMIEMGKTMMGWLPKGSIVSVEASVKHGVDKFTQTYMLMHSYYANEDRFINH